VARFASFTLVLEYTPIVIMVKVFSILQTLQVRWVVVEKPFMIVVEQK